MAGKCAIMQGRKGKMIEFYGEISMPCKVMADKLKKKYYAFWILILTLIVLAMAIANGVAEGTTLRGPFIAYAIFTVLLAALSVYLFIAPTGKSLARAQWLFRVQIEEGMIRFIQYTGDKEVEKKRELKKVRRVVKTKHAYLLYLPDAANVVICQRNLLKKGTFDELEALFRGKIREIKEK